MLLVEIVGTVVATHKDPKLDGLKLLIGKEIELDGTLTDRYHIAVDTVGVGPGEAVILVRGSSARMTETTDKKPVDTAIIAVVEQIEVAGKVIWRKK